MIRVLIVDDSATIRKFYHRWLSKAGDIEIVGEAGDPYEARDLVVKLKPDVMTLDIEMPRMNGLDFLEKLRKHYPVPTVLVSSVLDPGSENERMALQRGAAAVVSKQPSDTLGERVTEAVRFAHRRASKGETANVTAPRRSAPPSRRPAPVMTHDQMPVVAIGASSGGARSVEFLVKSFPAEFPPVVITQHMPEHFTGSFAQRLDGCCDLTVREAADGELLTPGTAIIAPGHSHLTVQRLAGRLTVKLQAGERVKHYRPNIDIALLSMATSIGKDAFGIILTGMGEDGAEGLEALARQGATTVVESEETAAVNGMPAAALQRYDQHKVVRLDEMPAKVRRWFSSHRSQAEPLPQRASSPP